MATKDQFVEIFKDINKYIHFTITNFEVLNTYKKDNDNKYIDQLDTNIKNDTNKIKAKISYLYKDKNEELIIDDIVLNKPNINPHNEPFFIATIDDKTLGVIFYNNGIEDITNYEAFLKSNIDKAYLLLKKIFVHNAYFINATFTKDANFRYATFTEGADFSKATFTEGADFSEATFTEGANFMGTTFTENADFISATFTENADFFKATFTKDANFSYINKDLRGDKLKQNEMNFNFVEIKTLNLSYATIGKIFLDSSVVENIILTSSTEIKEADSSDTWRILKGFAIKNHNKPQAWHFQDREYNALANKNDPAYKFLENNWQTKAIIWFNKITNNHGSSWLQPLIWFLVILLLGSLLEYTLEKKMFLKHVWIIITFFGLAIIITFLNKKLKLFFDFINIIFLLLFTINIATLKYIIHYIPFVSLDHVKHCNDWAFLVHIITSILLAFALWQFTQALRKFKDLG
jgi:hypothetical protein